MVDELVYCRKKGCGEPVCQLHHIIPRAIGGTDKEPRSYLCKKHHDILYLMLLGKIFEWYVPKEKITECYGKIEEFSYWWIGKE